MLAYYFAGPGTAPIRLREKLIRTEEQVGKSYIFFLAYVVNHKIELKTIFLKPGKFSRKWYIFLNVPLVHLATDVLKVMSRFLRLQQ